MTLVARRGKIVHFEAQGLADIDSKKPMMKDSIFRLASMSKPITAVAVMMMIEEGKVRLTDRVSAFIPEFKTLKVAVAKGTTDKPVQMPAFGRGGPPPAPPEFDLGAGAREITVMDLLTHTSGLMSGGVSGAEQAQAGAAQLRPIRWRTTFRSSRRHRSISSRARSGATAVSTASTSSPASSRSRRVSRTISFSSSGSSHRSA